MRSNSLILGLLAGLACSGTVQATLIDRGGGLIYDNVLNITWMQNANYGAGSSYDNGSSTTDGRMTWANAVAWAANLSYFDSVRNVTYDDWRLPTLTPVNGISFNYIGSFDGSSDTGWNISAPGSAYPGSTASELAYMYYVNLGNKGLRNTSGGHQTGIGLVDDPLNPNDESLFNYLKPQYWNGGAEYTNNPGSAWTFRNSDGTQLGNSKNADLYAWAVRPGDVAATPGPSGVLEPGTVGLLAIGFAGLGLARRRR